MLCDNMEPSNQNCKVVLVSDLVIILKFKVPCYWASGRRGGLMVSAFVPGASGPGSSPGWGHCVVFLGKTLNSHSASPHPGV